MCRGLGSVSLGLSRLYCEHFLGGPLVYFDNKTRSNYLIGDNHDDEMCYHSTHCKARCSGRVTTADRTRRPSTSWTRGGARPRTGCGTGSPPSCPGSGRRLPTWGRSWTLVVQPRCFRNKKFLMNTFQISNDSPQPTISIIKYQFTITVYSCLTYSLHVWNKNQLFLYFTEIA